MDVFLDKLESVIEKFHKSQSNIDLINIKLESFKEEIKELSLKTKNIESELDKLKMKSSNNESLWSSSIDFIVKVVYMLIVTYILYVLGWEGALEISP